MEIITLEVEPENNLYCPVCGQLISDYEGAENCPHILFTHFEEFGYVKPSLKNLKNKAVAETEENYNRYAPDILLEEIKSPGAFCFIFTSRGMACGPVSYACYIAIDFYGSDD